MSPVKKIVAYLVAAEDVADALDDLLDEIDPDGEEYGDAIAALRQFRRQGLELNGQTALPLPVWPTPQQPKTTPEAAQWI